MSRKRTITSQQLLAKAREIRNKCLAVDDLAEDLTTTLDAIGGVECLSDAMIDKLMQTMGIASGVSTLWGKLYDERRARTEGVSASPADPRLGRGPVKRIASQSRPALPLLEGP
jgi:hypothetical protein